ncbi:unnamed protein product [Victoria cruziana]
MLFLDWESLLSLKENFLLSSSRDFSPLYPFFLQRKPLQRAKSRDFLDENFWWWLCFMSPLSVYLIVSSAMIRWK